MTYDIKNDEMDNISAEALDSVDKTETTEKSNKDSNVGSISKPNGVVKEAILELVEAEDGTMQLRDVDDSMEPLVTIAFSQKVQDMLDDETYTVGQHMIHSAIQMVMRKQVSSWHANVYDEEPEHFS